MTVDECWIKLSCFVTICLTMIKVASEQFSCYCPMKIYVSFILELLFGTKAMYQVTEN